jgi:hypothetical protein
VPWPSGTIPAATAAAEPPDEPPAEVDLDQPLALGEVTLDDEIAQLGRGLSMQRHSAGRPSVEIIGLAEPKQALSHGA